MYELIFSDNDQAGWYARIYDENDKLVCECFDSTNAQMILALLNDSQG